MENFIHQKSLILSGSLANKTYINYDKPIKLDDVVFPVLLNEAGCTRKFAFFFSDAKR
jgi:hypothetical protein